MMGPVGAAGFFAVGVAVPVLGVVAAAGVEPRVTRMASPLVTR